MSHPDRAQITQHAFNFRRFFAQAEHHSGLGQECAAAESCRSFAETFGMSQHVERALIVSARPHLTIEARYRLDIVIEDFDWRLQPRSRPPRCDPLKSGTSTSTRAAGRSRFDRAGGRGEMSRAAVGQVVAIDRGDDHVVQAQARDRLGDSARLVGIERTHFAMRDRAVGTIARAHVAHQHEGGRAMREAFADIRAARFLADRMQPQLGRAAPWCGSTRARSARAP